MKKKAKHQSQSSKSEPRPIIKEFVKDINATRIELGYADPIKFRDDIASSKKRKAYKVPLEFLKFRKDNGRIASDVMTFEKEKGPLNETIAFGQSELKRFLERKDPDPTKDLRSSIIREGQEEPAVITADGFLINGNRRKMVLESLHDEFKSDDRYKYMRVVILPGLNEKEPPPTNEEIEQIENRYQFQKSGKAEYYNFDMALAVKRKLDLGIELEDILLDDPSYSNLKGKALQKKITAFKEMYIEPLKCVDKYLEYLNRPGHYNTISESRGDKEGRWQAFLDYYKVFKKISIEKERVKLGIQDGDEGKIENVAFKIIRARVLPGIDKKAHKIMRDLPRLFSNSNSKKVLFELAKSDFNLTKDEIVNGVGKEVDEKTKDTIWASKYAEKISWPVKTAFDILDQRREQETPIQLLTNALERLNHPNMNVASIEKRRIDDAIELVKEIQMRANEIEDSLYEIKKGKKVLAVNKSKKSKK